MSLTDDTHDLIREHYQNHFKEQLNTFAVDATCGNGFDTEFLCDTGFKKVVSFDIQEAAIKATQERVRKFSFVELIHDSHAKLEHHITQEIDCIMFNFGYLPNGDKTMTTQTESSLAALQTGTGLLSKYGLMTLMCYPGHPSGAQETLAIKEWFSTLDSKKWQIETHLAASPKPTAPILYTIKRTLNNT